MVLVAILVFTVPSSAEKGPLVNRFRPSEVLAATQQQSSAITWINETQAGGPPMLAGQAMVYDQGVDRFYMFGGQPLYRTSSQLWELDPQSYAWSLVTPPSQAPPDRADATLVDIGPTPTRPKQDFILLFGGWYNSSVGIVGRYSDTWYYFPTNNTWRQVSTSAAPPPLSDAAGSFDPESNTVIIYGGYNGTYYSATWTYSVENSSWYRTPVRSSVNPPPLADARMQFDSLDGIFVMFGGNNDLDRSEPYNHNNETWTFNMTSLGWRHLETHGIPPSRDYGYMAYDRDYDVFLLFGGYGEGIALSDTWLYSYPTDTWARLRPLDSPSPRFAGGIAYSPETQSFALYGGGFNNSDLRDTWAFRYSPQPVLRISSTATSFVAGGPIGFGYQISGNSTDIEYSVWTFGDGSSATGRTPVHSFVTPGRYIVSLSVTDVLGETFDTYMTVSVSSSEPLTSILEIGLLAVGAVLVAMMVTSYRKRAGRKSHR